MAVALLFFCYYSYSETLRGQSQNAAQAAVSWAMFNVLPQYTGLKVTSVNYQYTTVKQTQDPLTVSVQNLSATNNSYIFRSVDDWTGLPANTITKNIAVNNIGIQYWGPGEIKTTGIGSIKNTSVFYNYTYDTCALDIVTDTSCATYKRPVINYNTELVEQTSTDLKQYTTNTQQDIPVWITNPGILNTQRQTLVERPGTNKLLTREALSNSRALQALNEIPEFAKYSASLFGGVYRDVLKYETKTLPDSRNSLRLNRSQQQLHTKLVDLQYVKEDSK